MKTATLMLLALLALGACNTIRGAGEDIRGGGEAISDTASDTERRITE
ncbi:MAG: entericidin A/B family lipoprotein [Paracoccaceae bacterium]